MGKKQNYKLYSAISVSEKDKLEILQSIDDTIEKYSGYLPSVNSIMKSHSEPDDYNIYRKKICTDIIYCIVQLISLCKEIKTFYTGIDITDRKINIAQLRDELTDKVKDYVEIICILIDMLQSKD